MWTHLPGRGPTCVRGQTVAQRTCSVDGCDNPCSARGWCGKHYARWSRTGDLFHTEPRQSRAGPCSIKGCTGKPVGRGWCNKHYRRWQRNGDPLLYTPQITPEGECAIDDCIAPVAHRGWCSKHYQRWRASGDPSRGRSPQSRDGHCSVDGCTDTILSRRLCRRHYLPQPVVLIKQCYCGDSFESTRPIVKYCSKQCRKAAKAIRRRPSAKQYYESHKAICAERGKRYRLANPARRTLYAHARRARELGNRDSVGISQRDWQRALNRAAGKCFYCNTVTSNLHMDHVIPLVRGGRHAIGNVVPACSACNLAKHARYIAEWRFNILTLRHKSQVLAH